jgi:hypothetical protein
MGGSRLVLQNAVKGLDLNYPVAEATTKQLETLKITQEVTPVTFLVYKKQGQWIWVKNRGFIEKKQLIERAYSLSGHAIAE